MAAPLARRGELGVIAGALALVLWIVLSPSSGVGLFPDPVTSVSQPRPMPTVDGGGFFGTKQFSGSIPEFHVEIEPEFMRSMEAGLPTEHCSKVRFKKEPLKMFHRLRAAQAMIPRDEVKLHRIGRIPSAKEFDKFAASIGRNHPVGRPVQN